MRQVGKSEQFLSRRKNFSRNVRRLRFPIFNEALFFDFTPFRTNVTAPRDKRRRRRRHRHRRQI